MAMTRDERQARIDELKRWFAEQDEEYRDEGFPPDVQATWDQHDQELKQHQAEMKNLEERDAHLAELARQDSIEPGSGQELRDQGRGRIGPVRMVSRMSEREVYDLSAVRSNPFTPGSSNGELVDRARRAVDLASFPVVERQGGDDARVKRHVDGLLRRGDDEDLQSGVIARRILTTGSPAYRRAFAKLLSAAVRGVPGSASLSTEETRAVDLVRAAMAVGAGATGGFAVPYQLDPTVIPTSNLSVNPYRAVCRVETITGNEWRGVTSAGMSAGYALEAAEASDNSPTLVQPSVLAQRAQAFVPISIELTQDWGAVLGELGEMIQDAKDDLEATKFTTGTGTNEPQGLITGATTTVTGGGGAASFVIGDVYKTEEALGPRFRPRAVWFANRFTYNKARQFDTAGGAGIWIENLRSGINNGVPTPGNTGYDLIGYPANEVSAMAAALTTGSKIAVLGDPRYYLIVDRIGLDIEVIPHLFGAVNRFPTGQRGVYAFWRNSAVVLSANAFRVLTTA